MRLSREGWGSYNCEIRKGGARGKTVAYVDQEGIGGSENIYGHESKHTLQEIEDYIFDNCKEQWSDYGIQCYLMINDLNQVDNNDPKLKEYLLTHMKAFKNRDIKAMEVESLIGWWASTTAETKYYSRKK